MATGSRRWFQYQDDDGLGYAVQLDESTSETAALGFGPVDATTRSARRFMQVSQTIPLRPRYLLLTGTGDNAGRKRKVYVGSLEAPAWNNTQTSITLDGDVWSITSKVGEVRFNLPSIDTGLNDGDLDTNDAAGPA